MKLDDAVRIALRNVIKESITDVDVFLRPFEVDLLKDKAVFDQMKVLVEIRLKTALAMIGSGKEAFDALKELKVNPIRSVLVPKKTLFDFRQCSYVEPLDEVIFLSLAMILSNTIEKSRIHKNLNVVYSYRLKPDLISEKYQAYIFDGKSNYTSFRKSVSVKAKEEGVSVVVSCDIANFYDRLNLHRLENSLYAIPKIDKDVVKLINELLLY